jgi:2-keto-3-deoxy-galactonokinase
MDTGPTFGDLLRRHRASANFTQEELAAHSREAFADGVAFVPLAPMRDVALLLSVLAKTLEVKEVESEALRESLEKHLQGKQVLLVLDNFELLLTAVPLVASDARCALLSRLHPTKNASSAGCSK